MLEVPAPLRKGPVRGMRQHDAVLRDLDAELLAHVRRLLALQQPAAVGEEREGDVVLLEEGERLGGAGDRLGRPEEDAVDAGNRPVSSKFASWGSNVRPVTRAARFKVEPRPLVRTAKRERLTRRKRQKMGAAGTAASSPHDSSSS